MTLGFIWVINNNNKPAGTQSYSVVNKDLFCCVSPTAQEFCVEGGVCARATKLLRVRVFSSPRLCAFSSARSFWPELTLLCCFFFSSCPPTPPHPTSQTTRFCPGIARVSGRSPPAEAVSSERSVGGAGRPLWGECPLARSLLCCVHQLSRCSSCSAPRCSGSFGIFDIFRIFPPSLCWFRDRPI